MPEIRHYKVTQIREVEVTANELGDALAIADAAFKNGQNSDNGAKLSSKEEMKLLGVWGNTSTEIKEVGLKGERLR